MIVSSKVVAASDSAVSKLNCKIYNLSKYPKTTIETLISVQNSRYIQNLLLNNNVYFYYNYTSGHDCQCHYNTCITTISFVVSNIHTNLSTFHV